MHRWRRRFGALTRPHADRGGGEVERSAANLSAASLSAASLGAANLGAASLGPLLLGRVGRRRGQHDLSFRNQGHERLELADDALQHEPDHQQQKPGQQILGGGRSELRAHRA